MVSKKRKAPETPPLAAPRRRSQRISTSSNAGPLLEGDDSDSESGQREVQPASRKKKVAKSRGKPSGRRTKKTATDEDDYKEDVADEKNDDDDDDDDEEDAEDVRPKVTFIPLPKMRDTGGVEYVADRLHENTLLFLKDLRVNNNRPWLKTNDGEYRRALKDWESFVETMTDRIIMADDTIPELPFKDVNFRIYRDIRFSKDPTPYKAHFAAAWSRTGRKGRYACYYLHVKPGECFVGGGLWHPDGAALDAIRTEIDARPRRWKRVLTEPAFRKTFLSKAKGDDEKSVVSAYCDANSESRLATNPRGYGVKHPDINLLCLKDHTVGRAIPDSYLTTADGQAKIAEIMGALVPFVTLLNRVAGPGPGVPDDEPDLDD